MISFFQESPKLLVRVEIEQYGREINSFDGIVEKTFDVKPKAAPKHCFYSCEIDQRCFKGNCLAITKSHAQALRIKNPRAEKQKTWLQESQLSEHRSEGSEKARKIRKRKECRYDRNQKQRNNSLVATGVKTIEVEPGQKQQKNKNKSRDGANNFNKVKYYNCQKLGHYTNKCPDSKNLFQSRLIPH